MKSNLLKFVSYFIFWNKYLRKCFKHQTYKNNTFILLKGDKEVKVRCFIKKGLKLDVDGENNVIKISEKAKLHKTKITIIGNNNYVEIKEIPRKTKLNVSIKNADNTTLIWGENSTSNGTNIHMSENNVQVIVGENCMFSYNIEIWASDTHSVIDKKSGKLLNRVSKPLIIGNNCWVGYGSILTKNARLPNNTVVGAGSVVSKNFEKEYTAIAGNPAKVVNEEVVWDRENPSLYMEY